MTIKFINYTLREAVTMWLTNKQKGFEKYGHISHWDTSNVTNMSFIVLLRLIKILANGTQAMLHI